MNEFCTCGAQLPPDARFCHKCGKPQGDYVPAPEPDWSARREVAAPVPEPARLPAFHNPVAVRAGLLAASLAALLNMVPLVSYGFPIWLFAAGFFAVYIFERRTGMPLTVKQGARMGWITGVLSFAISTVFFTLAMISLAGRSGGLAAMYRERLEGMSVPDQSVREAIEMLQSPAGLTVVIIGSLTFVFVMITVICTLGGALGAKVLDKS